VVVFPKARWAVRGNRCHAADPDGSIGRAIDANRIVGSVVYPAAVLEAPGLVRVVEGRRFTLGELDGSTSARAEAISASFSRAGFKAPITSDIRGEIWLKIWGNLSFNPISALTHATLVDLLQFPLTRQLCADMMREAEVIAGKLGVTFRVGIDRRIAGAEKVGAHKTSMLQDVEAGRPPEIDALIGAVVELGRLTDTPTPRIDAELMRLSFSGDGTSLSFVAAQLNDATTSVLYQVPALGGPMRRIRERVVGPASISGPTTSLANV